jgi:hypothetical protein
MHIPPYRTVDNKGDGVVITIVDRHLRPVIRLVQDTSASASSASNSGSDD